MTTIDHTSGVTRRSFLAGTAGLAASAGAFAAIQAPSSPAPTAIAGSATPSRSRLNQSVCRWCYGGIQLETLCREAAAMGYRSVELLGEKEWEVPKQFGLACAVANGPTSITKGFNRKEHHDAIVTEGERLLAAIAAANAAGHTIPNMIVFSGSRAGLNDEDGIRNCVAGIKRLMPAAEKHRVTVVMELLNSKVDHKDYHADRTWWGVEVVKGVGSERFKLLYDIYHMQIMEGDVIRTIRDNLSSIAHFHTGGVPGRQEIDETQELTYPAICRAIADAGYSGYLGQEFIPAREPMTSLREAFATCSV